MAGLHWSVSRAGDASAGATGRNMRNVSPAQRVESALGDRASNPEMRAGCAMHLELDILS
eukprot:1431450-Rhodomonas_salina.2